MSESPRCFCSPIVRLHHQKFDLVVLGSGGHLTGGQITWGLHDPFTLVRHTWRPWKIIGLMIRRSRFRFELCCCSNHLNTQYWPYIYIIIYYYILWTNPSHRVFSQRLSRSAIAFYVSSSTLLDPQISKNSPTWTVRSFRQSPISYRRFDGSHWIPLDPPGNPTCLHGMQENQLILGAST